jgi:carbon monoxide dehydrogenase subunit G
MNLDNNLEITTPPKKVWNTLIDFKTTHIWVKEKIEIIPLKKRPLGKDFRFKVYVYRSLITLKYLGEILEYDPYKKMKVLLKGGISKDSDMTVQFHLSDLDKKTKFNYKVNSQILWAIWVRSNISLILRNWWKRPEVD